MYLPRDKNIRPLSTKLRNKPTPQERRLWYDFLRSYPIQFNRQRIIGTYIVDFYCTAARLAVELDGGQHYEQQAMEADAVRTNYLSKMGIYVLRFTNREIHDQFESVCTAIDLHVQERIKKPFDLCP